MLKLVEEVNDDFEDVFVENKRVEFEVLIVFLIVLYDVLVILFS